MRKLFIYSILFLIISLFNTLVTQAEEDETDFIYSDYTTYDYFDTVSEIKIWDIKQYPDDDELWVGLENIMKHVQNTFQSDVRYQIDENGKEVKDENGDPIPLPLEEQSELYQLNQTAGSNTPFQCSDDLYEIIKISIEYAEKTNGKLDPTIGPLVDLWKINEYAGEEYPIPAKSEIKAILPLIDYKLIEYDDTNKTILLPKEGMVLNLGAISKGFAADQIYQYLKSKNISHGIIDLGGNIYAIGQRYADRDGSYNWTIAIDSPHLNSELGYMGTLELIDKTVVTSGIYQRYIINPATQKKYSHILDPDDGYSVDNELASVSIISSNSTLADALSTSIFSLGLEDGLKYVEDLEGIEGIFITKDDTVYVTEGIENYNFKIVDKKFHFADDKTNLITPIAIGVGTIIIIAGITYGVLVVIKRKQIA